MSAKTPNLALLSNVPRQISVAKARALAALPPRIQVDPAGNLESASLQAQISPIQNRMRKSRCRFVVFNITVPDCGATRRPPTARGRIRDAATREQGIGFDAGEESAPAISMPDVWLSDSAIRLLRPSAHANPLLGTPRND